MTITVISSGVSSSSVTLNSPDEIAVARGGVVSAITVSSGGLLTVYAHGVASGSIVYDGGEEDVFGGTETGATIDGTGQSYGGAVQSVAFAGSAISATVLQGGIQFVSNRGTTADTVVSSGGQQVIEGSGAAANTVVSAGGRQYVSGAATATSVLDQGTMYVQDGGVAGAALISSGGIEIVSSAGTDKGGTVLNGGVQEIHALGFGSATFVSSGGSQIVFTGGTLASGTILDAGATVLSGGQATSMTIGSGGTETILNGAIDGVASIQSGGTQLISSGGRANAAVVNLGGVQTVNSGGLAVGAAVIGQQNVLAGGTASGTIAKVTGVVDVAGTVSGTIISAGGTQIVSSGAVVSGTIVSAGGIEQLLAGAAVSGTTLSGGSQTVSSGASAAGTIVRLGGTEIVSVGGLTSNTLVSSGGTELLSGGTATATTLLFGGVQIASSGGIGAGTTVSNGGQAVVSAGGVLSGGTVLNGGSVLVRSGGLGSGQTVSSGGTEIVSAGGSAVGAVVTGNGAGLIVSSGGLSTSAVISSGGAEVVSAGGVTSGSEITSGGQQVIVAGTARGAILDAGSIQILSAGGIASGTVVSSGSQQRVVAGGYTSASQVAGSVIVTSGGTANGGTLTSGGTETVSAGGVASGTVVSDGGQEVVLSGGVASGATLLSGGTQTISLGGIGRATTVSASGALAVTAGGVASGTILSSGGAATVVSGTLSGANLVGGGATVSAGGIASSTQVSAGTLTISSGGIARSGQVTSTGLEIISAGGVASATILSDGGGQSVLSGGVASATVVSSGGQMTVASGGGAVDVRGALGGAIVNHGVISGTVATSGTAITGSGGAVTVSNDGTIAGTGLVGGVAIKLAAGGTVSNAGVISGSNGTAIVFGGGTSNTLIMDVAGSITGVVSAVSSASNTLELSGTTSTGVISGYGTKFLGFQTLQVDSGSTWELAGTTVLGSGVTVVDDGTLLIGTGDSLTIAGGVNFASTAGTFAIANGGVLTLGGSVASGEVIDLVGSASKVIINDPANFGGVLAHFTRGDTVDLRSLPLSGTVVTTSGTTLTIQNGATSYAFTLDAALPANSVIKLTTDGAGGTNVRLVPLVTEALANDTGASSSDGLTSDGTLVGVADPNSTVTFYEGGTAIGSATATSSGTYSFLAGGLAQGAHTVSAVQTDAGSNTGSAVFAFTLDTVAPAAATAVRLDPASDTGVTGDGITSVTTPAITGSGVTGNTITLFDGGTLVGSATIVSGAWSIVPGTALVDGAHAFTVVQTDPAGNASPSVALSVTIDTVAPATPANLVLAPASDTGVLLDNITAANRPAITGSGTTGDTVVLYDGGTAIGSATVVSGAWSVTPGTALADGVHHFTAIESDTAGNASAATAALDITIDTVAPATPSGMVLDPGSDTGVLLDNITATALPAITGGGTDGDLVTLYDGGTAVGSATVVSGAWSITPGTALTDGVHHFTATERDAAGNTSSATAALDLTIDTTAPLAPSGFRLDPGSDTGVLLDDVTATTQPAITGSGISGDVVKLYEGSTLLGSATVVNGAWSIAPAAPLVDGVHTLTATATDAAGNTSATSAALALTIDTVAPAAPTGLLLDPASDTGVLLDNRTAITPPAITGSGITGDTVELYEGNTLLGSATVVNGAWSITPGTALADGVHSLTARATDAAGNVSQASAPLAITIDRTAPVTPTALLLDPGSDTGVLLDNVTATTQPAITGSGTTGDTIYLYEGTSTRLGSATVVNGAWSITPASPLADGVHIFTAYSVSSAGNVSTASAPLAVTIDTTASSAPTGLLLDPGSDTGVLLDNVTAATQPAITGSGTTGDTVKLYEGSTLLGSAVVVNGAWSITPGSALADGVHTLTATATDPAGNISPASVSLALTIDTTAPSAPTGLLLDPGSDTGVPLDNVTAERQPAITGSGTTGDTVKLYDGSTLLGSATVVNGAWSITPGAELANGTYNLTATATDAAGNVSGASTALSLTIDVPASPTALTLDPASDTGVLLDNVTATVQPAITGSGTTGDTVRLFEGRTLLGSATVVNGAWSITPRSALADRVHNLTAISTNAAGNTSLASAPLALTIDSTAPSAPAGLLLAPGSDTGVLLDNVTAATQPAITGSGTTGDTIRLYEGSTLLGSATVVNGAWSIMPGSALTDGVHALTATATDPAGNTSPASASLALTIDTTAPAAPAGLLLDPGSDTGVLLDNLTATRQPAITGSGMTGDTVKLYEGTTLLGSAIVVNGAWSITPGSALADGAHTLTATATDPAGNASATSAPLTLTIDATPPSAPTGLLLDPGSDTGIPLDNLTAATQPAITGAGTTGDTMTLYDGSVPVGSAAVVNGLWSIAPASPLADGVHHFSARATDPAGNVSAPSSTLDVSIVTTRPSAPSSLALDPGSDTGALGDRLTAIARPAITGAGVDGDSITLYDGNTVIGTGIVSGGAWSVTPVSALTDGVHHFAAAQTGVNGSTSTPSATLDVTISTVTPASPGSIALAPASDTGVAGDRITARTSPAINGTGLTGATVTLYEGGVALGSGTVVGGVWSVTPGSPLADGVHRLTAIQTDPAGNASAPSAALDLTIDSQAPSAPGALALSPVSDTGVPGDRQTRITMPVIIGSGPGNGDTVTLYEGGVAVGSGTVTSGSWAIAPGTPLQDGVHRFTATETDAAGNVSPVSAPLDITIRTVTPDAPTGLALTPASDTGVPGDRVTSVTTPAVTGSGVDGDTVTLLDGFTPIGTATVANGVWSIRPGQPLTDGAHRLTAKQTDPAGNVSPGSAPLDITIDSVAPAAPGGLALAPASDTGTLGDRITRASTPTILGTGASGETVTLYDGGVAIGSAVVVNGSWAIAATTPLRDGVHRFTAVQSDLAGNVSASSSTLDITIDTVAPAAPTLTAPAPSTNPAQPVIGGLAEPGATVQLFEGSASVGSARADSAGVWQFAFVAPLAAGAHSLTATATDDAGGTSPLSAPLTVTIAADQSYTVTAATSTGQTIAQVYAPTGQIDRIDTFNTNGLVKSVSNTKAILQIYDDAGRLIGTITQPSQSAFSQPVFDSTGKPLAATTVSGPAGSEIAFLMETNEITTQGNDTVSAGSGDSIVFAAGPSTKVIGGSGTLLFVGGAGTATVRGGSGSSSVFGAAGGGYLEGGSAGRNVLVAGGGNTTLVGGGTGDILVATTGTTQMMLKAGNVAFGGSGDTTMHGAAGSIMVGNSGRDLMIAGDGAESLYAGTGQATLIGGTGNNTLVGGAGQTTIMGGLGNDMIVAAGGSTVIMGGNGTDTIFAGTGDTVVTEGNGTNLMVFNTGNATVTGGTGRDTYIVSNGHAGGRELIQNFKVGVDQIQTFGYAAGSTRVQAVGANTLVSLSDGTTITLAGVTQLNPNSIV